MRDGFPGSFTPLLDNYRTLDVKHIQNDTLRSAVSSVSPEPSPLSFTPRAHSHARRCVRRYHDSHLVVDHVVRLGSFDVGSSVMREVATFHASNRHEVT